MTSCAADFSVHTYLDPITAVMSSSTYSYMYIYRNYFQNKSNHANISNKIPVHLRSTDIMNILRPHNTLHINVVLDCITANYRFDLYAGLTSVIKRNLPTHMTHNSLFIFNCNAPVRFKGKVLSNLSLRNLLISKVVVDDVSDYILI